MKTERGNRIKCGKIKEGQILLILGKGHEKYQEIKGIHYEFDDKQIAKGSIEKDNILGV